MRSLLWFAGICLLFVLTHTSGAVGATSTAKPVAKTYTKDYEAAITIIKKYESLHKNHPTCVGYGHTVLPGEKYKKRQNLTEAQADALLREDFDKLCAKYRSFGRDSILLAALAYNIGIGNVAKSTVYKRLKAGNRDIRESYIAHCRYRGKVLSQLQRRRIEEFEVLFKK